MRVKARIKHQQSSNFLSTCTIAMEKQIRFDCRNTRMTSLKISLGVQMAWQHRLCVNTLKLTSYVDHVLYRKSIFLQMLTYAG